MKLIVAQYGLSGIAVQIAQAAGPAMQVIVTQLNQPPAVPAMIAGGIAAAPGGQAGATLLLARVNIVTGGAAGWAVRLNPAAGGRQEVFADMGFDLLVFPPLGMAVRANGTNVPVTVLDGKSATFTFDGVSTWLDS